MKVKVVGDNMANLSKAWIALHWTCSTECICIQNQIENSVKQNKAMMIMSKTKITWRKNTYKHEHKRIHTYLHKHVSNGTQNDSQQKTIEWRFQNSTMPVVATTTTTAATKSTKVIVKNFSYFAMPARKLINIFTYFIRFQNRKQYFGKTTKRRSQRFNNGTIDPDSRST